MTLFNFSPSSPLNQPDFVFGVATAAQQIEGARNVDGRVDSIWDWFAEQPGKVANGDTIDQACDHYHLWRDDIELIKDLGVGAYRFSISWPRVITSLDGQNNQAGIDFYKRLLERLHQLNITPFTTLYHWDLPQYLNNPADLENSGWLNRDTAYRFADYTQVVCRQLGELLPVVTTFNEPWCSAMLSYGKGIFAPGLTHKKHAFHAAHNLLLAHGLAMDVIRTELPSSQAGIVLNLQDSQPASAAIEDVYAGQLLDEEFMQMYMRPLFKGEYPELITEHYPDYFDSAWLRDMPIISQPMDFLGLNYYTRVRAQHSEDKELGYREIATTLETTEMGWEIYPRGLYNQLTKLNNMYSLPAIYITENGMADNDTLSTGEINDHRRCNYIHHHLLAVEEAIKQGVDIKGYFAWSLMDNFEWAEGYAKRFGLYYVDYSNQRRIAKLSAKLFQQFLRSR